MPPNTPPPVPASQHAPPGAYAQQNVHVGAPDPQQQYSAPGYYASSEESTVGPPPANYAPPPPQPSPPTPHGPPAPPESSVWNSSTEQGLMAQFVPPGKCCDSASDSQKGVSASSGVSSFGCSTISGSCLPTAFVVQSTDRSSDIWVGDSRASCHMTNNAECMYDLRTPPPERQEITIGDGRRQKVEYIGNIDVVFHGTNDVPITICDVSYVPGLGFNLFSFHTVQKTHRVVLDAAGAHIADKGITFPRETTGSYLRATRIAPKTIGFKPRTNIAWQENC